MPARPARRSPRGRSLRRRYFALRSRLNVLHRQLKFAEQVQRKMLPQAMPEVDGVRFAAALRPSNHMAGDFYNAFRLDRERVGFYIGDVMGHGPAAAMLSVFTMQSLRTKRIHGHTYEIIEPGAVLAQLNDALLDAEFPGTPFVTLTYGVLDVPQRTWTYCDAGHPHPLVVRQGRPVELLEPTAPLLGVMEAAFVQRTVPLQPGDRLVLYSDGALAATWEGHGSGIEGLASLFAVRDGQPLQAVLDEAIAGVRFHDQPEDDISLLAVELAG